VQRDAAQGRMSRWLLVAWLLPHMAAAQARPDDAIYAYTDHKGQLIYVERLEDIPLSLREFARRVDGEGGAPPPSDDTLFPLSISPDVQPLLAALHAAGGASGEDSAHERKASATGPVLYRYRSPSGAPVYTNIEASVPPAQRAHARVDLSHVALNSKVGRELDERLDREHARLVSQPLCRQLSAAAAQSLPERVWYDHAPLLICGAAIVGFIVITPWMLRRVGGREWARTLSMAVPALAVAGIALYATLTSARGLSALKDSAAPCDKTAWNALDSAPNSLIKRLQLLDRFDTQRAALERIAQEGRE
jgi:hypothetical protein